MGWRDMHKLIVRTASWRFSANLAHPSKVGLRLDHCICRLETPRLPSKEWAALKAQPMAAKEALISLSVLHDGTWTFGGRAREALNRGMLDLMDPSPPTPRLSDREHGPQWRSLAP